MKNYIVQFRRNENGPLVLLMKCYAKSMTHAIAQGASVLARNGDDVREIIATEN